MKRETYKVLWVQGMYEEQATFPGEPMTLEGARAFLEEAKEHSEDWLPPPEGMTAGELCEAWNRVHEWAIDFAREDEERHGGR